MLFRNEPQFLGILAKEFAELLAITWAGKRRTTLPASYCVGIGAINRRRYIAKRPSTSFSFVFETLISHRSLLCLIGSHVYVLLIYNQLLAFCQSNGGISRCIPQRCFCALNDIN